MKNIGREEIKNGMKKNSKYNKELRESLFLHETINNTGRIIPAVCLNEAAMPNNEADKRGLSSKQKYKESIINKVDHGGLSHKAESYQRIKGEKVKINEIINACLSDLFNFLAIK